MYGQFLHIHQKAFSSDGISFPLVVLASGVTRLQYRTPPPSADWTKFLIPLTASKGWEIGNGSGNQGTPATEDDLRRVLSNINWFAVNADWQTGSDMVSMDRVFVGSGGEVPEPASVLLSSSALAVFAFLRRRGRAKY